MCGGLITYPSSIPASHLVTAGIASNVPCESRNSKKTDGFLYLFMQYHVMFIILFSSNISLLKLPISYF